MATKQWNKWTANDIETLTRLYGTIPNSELADILGRTIESIGHKANRLFLSKRQESHGLHNHLLYKVWKGMIQRTTNPNNKGWKYYGGRGITCCEKWRHSFKAFYDFAISNGWKKGLTIDRIDNDGNYDESNVRFVSHATNMRNQSTTKLTVEKVKLIRQLYSYGVKQKMLAKEFNTTNENISRVVLNKTWKNLDSSS